MNGHSGRNRCQMEKQWVQRKLCGHSNNQWSKCTLIGGVGGGWKQFHLIEEMSEWVTTLSKTNYMDKSRIPKGTISPSAVYNSIKRFRKNRSTLKQSVQKSVLIIRTLDHFRNSLVVKTVYYNLLCNLCNFGHLLFQLIWVWLKVGECVVIRWIHIANSFFNPITTGEDKETGETYNLIISFLLQPDMK